MKKIKYYLICCLLGAATISATAQRSWDIGSPTASDVKASLSTPTLTVSGTGAMRDLSSAPWGRLNQNLVTTVVINNGVTSIGGSAFKAHNLLTEVKIPASVATIGNEAFANCRALGEVTNNAETPQEINANVFQNVNIRDAVLFVPGTALAAYRATPVWKDF